MYDSVEVLTRTVEEIARTTVPVPVAGLRARAARRRRIHRTIAAACLFVTAGGATAGALIVAGQHAGSRQQLHMAGDGPVIVEGGSAPSPFPSSGYNQTGYRDICDGSISTDGAGRLTAARSYLDQNVLTPAGSSAATGISREQALAAYARSGFHVSGHPQAVFGLLSAPAPAQILPGGSTSPYFQQTPVWLVAVCDAPFFPGHGGPARPQTAPSTAPSPGPAGIGVLFMTFDTSGRPVGGVDMSNRPSQAQLDESFVHVPWTRVPAQPGDDPRQVRISYPAAEPCATFDHLDVYESDTWVAIRVWLRHNAGDPTGCTPTARHTAIVGLTRPLGQRSLVDQYTSSGTPKPAPSPMADPTSK